MIIIFFLILFLVSQSCPTLHNPTDCSPSGSSVHGDSRGKNTGVSGLPWSPPGDLPNPEIEPRSPMLQVDSLESQPPGKPMNAGEAYPFSRGPFWPRNQTRVSCTAGGFFMPGLPVHHQLLESTQNHVNWVGDAIQPSHPFSSPSPPALNLSQDQDLCQWVSSSHWEAKDLEPQSQSLQWIVRVDFLEN